MTKKTFESIKQFEQVFNWSIHNNFFRVTPSEFETLMGAYNDTFYTPLSDTQKRCSACRLTAMKKLGAEYFKKKEELQKEAEEKENKDANKDNNKKKAGRPPKIKLED